MKILYFSSALCSLILVFSFSFYFRDSLERSLDDYAIKKAEQQFGTSALAPKQEDKIRRIAEEMNITDRFVVRKMNRTALLTFGYHNAFVYFFNFLNCIPLNNSPVLFVSEGFFDDLSDEEQRFLIGHELIHIQEHHTHYLNLVLLSVLIFLSIVCALLKKTIYSYIQKRVSTHYYSLISALVFYGLLFICYSVSTLSGLAYRRHIEWVADCRSLALLESYDGALKLTERWQKEFNLPLHNPYLGLLSDHPSCHERIAYYLHLKNRSKEVS